MSYSLVYSAKPHSTHTIQVYEPNQQDSPYVRGLRACSKLIDAIFATSDKGTALAIIDEFSKFWMSIIGTRGATGKKTVNASTMFNNLFESEEPEEHHVDDSGLDESVLDNLENGLAEYNEA